MPVATFYTFLSAWSEKAASGEGPQLLLIIMTVSLQIFLECLLHDGHTLLLQSH